MADTDRGSATPFAEDVLSGLAHAQKAIPSRWLYDERGSELFEEITQLPEYYPTRTETRIFTDHAGDMAAALGGNVVLVEYGAGAAVKTRILLDALDAPLAYVPIDISADFLKVTADALRADYSHLIIHPIAADFLAPGTLEGLPDQGARRVGFFPGSTVGNLSDAQIVGFFSAAREALGPDARFVLGADLKKDPAILVPAYDDAAGVTAAFNLNLLTRINRELDGDFEISAFRHEARWNAADSRIEMHLVATRDQEVTVLGRRFSFQQGETIHTENSRKFTPGALAELLARSGWQVETSWQDAKGYFSVLLLR